MYNVLERVCSVLCVSCLFVTLLRVHLALSAVLFPLTVMLYCRSATIEIYIGGEMSKMVCLLHVVCCPQT